MPSSRCRGPNANHVKDFSTTSCLVIASKKLSRPITKAEPTAMIPIGAPRPGVFLPKKTIRKKAEIGRMRDEPRELADAAGRDGGVLGDLSGVLGELDHAVTTS